MNERFSLLFFLLFLDVHCDLHDGSQCGLNGKCVYGTEYDQTTSLCYCNKGFVGDGFECQRFDQIIGKDMN